MGCLRYPRKQTTASAAAMTDPDPSPLFADECTVIACCGGAKVTANHLASTIHCTDDEIIGWLERRRRALVNPILTGYASAETMDVFFSSRVL
jgi:hypothetical protein